LRKTLTVIAVAVLATMFAAPRADAATPKAACYNAWISTKSLMYQVNLAYNSRSAEWEAAYEANLSAYFAFMEAFAVEQGVRGASLIEVRDHLDDALVELFYLSQMNLPKDIATAVKSATWYTTYARKVVNSSIQN
jgi:hypothetical protein